MDKTSLLKARDFPILFFKGIICLQEDIAKYKVFLSKVEIKDIKKKILQITQLKKIM